MAATGATRRIGRNELLMAATGAIWKCAISAENVHRFQQLKTLDHLVALLNEPEEVSSQRH